MTIQYNEFNKKLTTLILFGFAFTFFTSIALTSRRGEQPDRTTARGRAEHKVSMIRHEVHAEYLNCYPLAPAQKKACTEKLADKHLRPEFEREYKIYKDTFQHESEKLGFKYFLNNKGVSCDSVGNKPFFDDKEEAYIVLCNDKHKYYMQFNYENNQWNLREHNHE